MFRGDLLPGVFEYSKCQKSGLVLGLFRVWISDAGLWSYTPIRLGNLTAFHVSGLHRQSPAFPSRFTSPGREILSFCARLNVGAIALL